MSVDHSGVGGIGIKITDYLDKFMALGAFTKEEWEDDNDECLNKLGFSYWTAGNSYTGNIYYYSMVKGKNLEEVIVNAPAFIESFRKWGIELTLKDLRVVSDISIW